MFISDSRLRSDGVPDVCADGRSSVWRPPWWSGWLHVPVALFALLAGYDLVTGRAPGVLELNFALLLCGLIFYGAINLRAQAFSAALCGPCPGRAKRVALTFDDGPDPETTPLVLDALGRCRATFFVVGEKARAHPELIAAMRAAGHQVASHGERHCWRAMTGVTSARRLVLDGLRTLRELGVESGLYFRPPYGLMIPPLVVATREAGVTVVGWSRRSFDTVRRDSPEGFTRKLAACVKNGDIVLLHDAPERRGERPPLGVTAAAFLVAELAARGFELVTVEDLLAGSE